MNVDEKPAEGTSFQALISARPQYAAALNDIEIALWGQNLVAPVLLELCRLRIAQILGCEAALEHRTPQAVTAGLDEALVGSLSRWATDPAFDDRMKACLGYAEQVLMDAQGVTDSLARDVIDQMGEGGLLVLTYACGMFETTQRSRLVLGAKSW